jgi:hypothetical protein
MTDLTSRLSEIEQAELLALWQLRAARTGDTDHDKALWEQLVGLNPRVADQLAVMSAYISGVTLDDRLASVEGDEATPRSSRQKLIVSNLEGMVDYGRQFLPEEPEGDPPPVIMAAQILLWETGTGSPDQLIGGRSG